jgi:hypothetical protein
MPLTLQRVAGAHIVVGEKMVGRDDARAGSVRATVTSREEVRPMNAVSMWVLSLVVTVGRLT